MPRIRSIKPETFLSESLADLPLSAMVSFIGIWTQADDQGRLKDSPRVLNALLWGTRPEHTLADMESDLEVLSNRENSPLCRYQVGEKSFLHVTNWKKHQKINRPTPSSLPPCPYCDDEVVKPGKGEPRHLKGGLFNFISLENGADKLPESSQKSVKKSSVEAGKKDAKRLNKTSPKGSKNAKKVDDVESNLAEISSNFGDDLAGKNNIKQSQNKADKNISNEPNFSALNGVEIGSILGLNLADFGDFLYAAKPVCNTNSLSPHGVLIHRSRTPQTYCFSDFKTKTLVQLCDSVEKQKLDSSPREGSPSLTSINNKKEIVCNTNSLSPHGVLIEDSLTERKGKEGKGKEPTPDGRRHARACARVRGQAQNDEKKSPERAKKSFSETADIKAKKTTSKTTLKDETKTDTESDQKMFDDDAMNQESLFEVPQPSKPSSEDAEEKPKPKRRNSKATEERCEAAKRILDPWWVQFGKGWTQSYVVVRGVIISVLANGVPEEDVRRAMEKLGRERKPISGGTIGFALSKMGTRQNSANITGNQNYRDPSTYTSTPL